MKEEVVYNVVYDVNNKFKNSDIDIDIEDILTKKLLRVILNLETNNIMILNSSLNEV